MPHGRAVWSELSRARIECCETQVVASVPASNEACDCRSANECRSVPASQILSSEAPAKKSGRRHHLARKRTPARVAPIGGLAADEQRASILTPSVILTRRPAGPNSAAGALLCGVVSSCRVSCKPMIVEGRTITNLAELQEFCEAAVAAAHADPPRSARHRGDAPGRREGLRRAGFLGGLNAALHAITRRPYPDRDGPSSADDYVVLSGGYKPVTCIASPPRIAGRGAWALASPPAILSRPAMHLARGMPDPHRHDVPQNARPRRPARAAG